MKGGNLSFSREAGLARLRAAGRGGFTLMELLIAVLILAFVTGVIYELYLVQYRNWISQDLRSEMLQRVRVAVHDMTRDMQMAGFRPQVEPVNVATATEFTFEFQNKLLPTQPAGFTKDRRISYRFDSANNRIMKRVRSWNTAIAGADKYTTNAEEVYLDNITNLTFAYYNNTGATMTLPVTGADLTKIRRVDVSVTAQTSDIDPITKNRRSITETSQIFPRNLGIEESTLDQTCPATPTGLASADPHACGELDLTWAANNEADLAGYRIFYGLIPGEYSGSTTVGVVTSATLSGLTNNARYYIALGSFDESSNSCALSTEVTGDGPSPDTNPTPNAPQQTAGLDATVSGPVINLTWDKNETTYPSSRPDSDSNVTGYNVYRSTDGTTFTQIATAVSGNTYADTPGDSLSCTILHYKVEPVNCLGTVGPASEVIHGDGTGLPDGTNAADVPSNGVTATAPSDTSVPSTPTGFLSKSGYRRNYLVWDNPNDPDFDHTVVRYSTSGFPASPSDGIAVQNAPGGNGRFDGNSGQTMTFTHDGGTSPPSLSINTTYYYTIFAYDKCGNVSTAQASAQTASAQCGDEDSGPSSGVPPSPILVTPAVTNSCQTTQATINWTLIDDSFPGGIFDLAGYNVYRSVNNPAGPFTKQNGSLLFGTYPGTRTYTDSTVTLGNTYYYKITATDCDWEVNGGVNGGGESLASAVAEVAPGAFTRSPTNTDVLSQGLHHERVVFYVKNRKANPPTQATGQIRLQSVIPIYSNPNARVSRITILNDLADGTDDEVIYSDTTAPIGAGSGSTIPLSGSVILNGQENVPIAFEFRTSSNLNNDTVDMRNFSISLTWYYESVAFDLDDCASVMNVFPRKSPDVGTGPVDGGVTTQDEPVSPTDASTTPGVNIAAKDETTNVNAHVHDDAGKGIASVTLYWAVTNQTETKPPAGGWTAQPMTALSSQDYVLDPPGSPSTQIPAQNGMRVWYFIYAFDNIGNFDRDPDPDQGAFTYDQLN
jgi:prepilin-type N-terminal cleavage/methylation domain-containing protein